MAIIKPFKAWHYNLEKIKNWDDVIVPPYDVISPEGLKKLKNKSVYSFTHVILAEGENRHQKAAETFKSWQSSGVIEQDKKESLYFYRQKFHLGADSRFLQRKLTNFDVAQAIERVGFFARVGLEDYENKIVLPHEKTFSGPKQDRYNLMQNMQGNAEPVFLGYPGQRFAGDEFKKAILASKPQIAYTDSDGVSHELWAVSDPAIVSEVEKALSSQQLFILDGHHRYETALKFYKDHQKSDARLSHRYVLAQVCSLDQFGALILPTHRLVRGLRADFSSSFLQTLSQDWIFESVDSLQAMEKLLLLTGSCAFGLVLSGKMYVLTRKNPEVQKLDLEVLHEDLIPQALSPLAEESQQKAKGAVGGDLHDASHGGCELAFSKSAQESVSKVESGEYQLAILVRPNTVQEVMDTARQGKVMPHKSTFFFPKIPSGLVVNLFE